MATEEKQEQPAEEKKDETVDQNKKEEEDGQVAADGDAKSTEPASPAKEAAPQRPRPTTHKADYDKDVVYLYQFSRTPVLPSLSPFCMKVEAWLRIAGIKYENVDHKMKYRSKKGQLPFVELNGEEIADSTMIIRELGNRFGCDLDKNLSPEQMDSSHAMIAMIENHLCWVNVWWRSKFPDSMLKGYKLNLQQILNSKIPNGLLNFVFKFTHSRKGAKKVKAHGLGVHKPEEIYEFGQSDLKVLSNKLGEKPFFFGNEPTTLDIVAFAHLAQIEFVDKEIPYPLRDWMQENCSNLVAHINRMKEKCFNDWDDMCTNLDLNSHLPKPVPEPKEEEKQEQEKEKGDDDKEKEGEKIDAAEKEQKEEAEKNKEDNQEKEK